MRSGAGQPQTSRMAGPANDTDPAALAHLSALYARTPPEAKLRMVRDLTIATSRLALAGLRARHPGEADAELLLRLASIRLGEGIVAAAYGVTARR